MLRRVAVMTLLASDTARDMACDTAIAFINDIDIAASAPLLLGVLVLSDLLWFLCLAGRWRR